MIGSLQNLMEPIEDLDVLVTGAGRGLGRGVACFLGQVGARVWIVSEIESELEMTAAIIRKKGGWVKTRVADLSSESQRSELAKEIKSGSDRLVAIINNAAVLERQSLQDIQVDSWEETLKVNLTAPVFLARDLISELLEKGGSIINVSSQAGVLGFADQSAYCASKFGIEAFTRCLALELVGSRVSVNSVTPGLKIKPTSITDKDISILDPKVSQAWADPISLGPAFHLLARLRGGVSGCRFNALTLAKYIAEYGSELTVRELHTVAEYVVPGEENG
ncbi:MAG TPA: SDR family oxidoreductase [Gemmatimonadetes bacterium]|jgi:NAD(P)-dependent dehydrogenase (short-subunit alcohol dehydrogenase family)|nr:SDR family oxidoreductase [Gemmatimonadota bacterium]